MVVSQIHGTSLVDLPYLPNYRKNQQNAWIGEDHQTSPHMSNEKPGPLVGDRLKIGDDGRGPSQLSYIGHIVNPYKDPVFKQPVIIMESIQEISNGTHVSRTPKKPGYLITRLQFTWSGVRWDSVPFNHGNPSYPPPQSYPPKEIRPYDQGLLTIGFP